ncbi:MAG: hypothetical protein MJY50_01175 [Bacteroidales bacterium]|nr:hypothetical protein [Bacteroidales bacterium]
MKRYIIAAISAALVVSMATAQTMTDAINTSQNNYYGTARTVGLGNAVTAVGGDLGTIGINPAGSAVAGYSQFTITPGLTISANGSSYAPSYAVYPNGGKEPLPDIQEFGAETSTSRARFYVPNLGIMIRFDTGRRYGVKSVSFGIVSNGTSNFNNEEMAGGINRGTSITGAFAAFATSNADGRGKMLPGKILSWTNPFSGDYYWNYVAAYWGGLINYNDDAGTYFGSAETVSKSPEGKYDYFVKGDLRQRHSTQTYGSKNDIVINAGLDIDDKVFVGLNLGLPVMSYRHNQYFYENAYSDPAEDFVYIPEYYGSTGEYNRGPLSTYEQCQYNYSYMSNVTGVYGKLGVIVLPTDNLRLGAAFQSPVAYSVSETWQVKEECSRSEYNPVRDAFDIYHTDSSYSPEGNYKYRLTGPYSVNAGIAYTFGTVALISADYEMTDFSVMRYRANNGNIDSSFDRVNRITGLFCGPSHSVRAGVEVKPVPMLALRAGFSYKTDPTYYRNDEWGNRVTAYDYDRYYDKFESGYYALASGKHANSDNVWAVSAGLGFLSAGSFFADFAVRMTSFATTYFEPYNVYLEGEDAVICSPAIRSKRNLWDVMLTFGWRF